METLIKTIKNILFSVLTIIFISAILIIPIQLNSLIYEVKKLQAITVQIYKEENKRFQNL